MVLKADRPHRAGFLSQPMGILPLLSQDEHLSPYDRGMTQCWPYDAEHQAR